MAGLVSFGPVALGLQLCWAGGDKVCAPSLVLSQLILDWGHRILSFQDGDGHLLAPPYVL